MIKVRLSSLKPHFYLLVKLWEEALNGCKIHSNPCIRKQKLVVFVCHHIPTSPSVPLVMFMLHDRNVLGMGGKKDTLGWKKAWLHMPFFCLKPFQTKPISKLFRAVRKYALLLWRCRLSVNILSWCPHKDQITGKEDKPIKCWNGKPLAENLCLCVMWNCYKIHRGILAKRGECQLRAQEWIHAILHS